MAKSIRSMFGIRKRRPPTLKRLFGQLLSQGPKKKKKPMFKKPPTGKKRVRIRRI